MSDHKYITFVWCRGYEFCQVRFVRGDRTQFRKLLSVDKYGGREKTLALAIEIRDKNAPRFKKDVDCGSLYERCYAAPGRRNSTGIVGVSDCWPASAMHPFISAYWSETQPDGSRKQAKKSLTYRNAEEREAALKWAIRLRKKMEKLHYRGKAKPP